MSAAAAPTPAQLLVYAFAPDARFEGQLGGALQRMETGGTLRVLEAIFIHREVETGELAMIDVRGDGAGSLIAPVLDFRLDPAARRRATRRALAAGTPGISADTVRRLGEPLAPGAAIAALLIEHTWAQVLADAVARTAGTPLIDEFVQARTLAELEPELLLAAAARRGDSAQSS
ncbi:MAG: hypothetical protein ACLP8S_33415 [Solirubrobacteraceae bacterium]